MSSSRSAQNSRKRASAPRSKKRAGKASKWLRRLWRPALVAVLLAAAMVFWAILARQGVPGANTDRERFDVIVVLGVPSSREGNPSAGQLARVNEAVREYERGVAPRILFSGGAAHNRFVEAEVMAKAAQAEGIPADAILKEGQSGNMFENACFTTKIMQTRGWNSAEVISSEAHLPRAAMIFQKTSLQWRMHVAPSLTPEPAWLRNAAQGVEILKTVRFLTWARLTERCEP